MAQNALKILQDDDVLNKFKRNALSTAENLISKRFFLFMKISISEQFKNTNKKGKQNRFPFSKFDKL